MKLFKGVGPFCRAVWEERKAVKLRAMVVALTDPILSAIPFMRYSEAKLLEICNDVRIAGETSVLEELLPGDRTIADSCLIAKNLNFSCEVDAGLFLREGEKKLGLGWVMIISNQNLLYKLSNKLGWEVVTLHAWDIFNSPKVLRLPKKLGRSAMAFDKELYRDELYQVEA